MPQESVVRRHESAAALSHTEILRDAGEVIRAEAGALSTLAERLDADFCAAVELVLQARGCVIVTGMGKAGLVGQKIAATLASTGTRAHFLHPAEAIHGDLGRVHQDDIVLLLSQSGETAEVIQILPALAESGVPVVAITGRKRSTVSRAAAATIYLGPIEEACPLGLAPSTSTTAMMAVGDALALIISRIRGFRAEDFARFHPGGSLGRQLSKVDEPMRPLADCRVALQSKTVRDVVVACSKPGRRTGAIMLTDELGRLTGMFTDSDLARLFEQRSESALDRPICEVMTPTPYTVVAGTRLRDAIEQMADRKISELPVVTPDTRPIGLLDVTDILDPADDLAQSEQPAAKEAAVKPNVRIFDDGANAR